MRLAVSRAAIAAVALVAALLLLAAPFVRIDDVQLGADFGVDPNSRDVLIGAVVPGGIADRAGVRPGDRLRLVPDTQDEAIRFRTLRRNESVTFRDQRSGKQIVLSDPSAGRIPIAAVALQPFIFVAFAIVALVLVRRRSDNRRALELAAFLAAFALSSALSVAFLTHVRSFWWVIVAIVTQSGYAVGGAFATIFAASFPRPAPAGFRRVVRRLAPVAAAVVVVFSFIGIGGSYVWQASHLTSTMIVPLALSWTFFVAGSVGSLILTLRESKGLERQQVRWIAVTFAVGFSGLLVLFASLLFGFSFRAGQYAALTVLVIPFGLAYVILRHRVVDVGFALNRAAVFGGVSLVVVAAFVSLEWFISKYLLTVGHVASSAVELAVALAIGFSLRPVHARIDRLVDDLFFRKRHEADQRLRRFARELPYFTDRTIALERTREIVMTCAESGTLAIFERAPGGFGNVSGDGLPFLDENDAAVVAFKAFHEPVVLDESGSALGDGIAFGLQIREETIGFLVLGPKTGGDAYDPDERDALEAVARSLASLLDALEIAELKRRLSALAPHALEGL
jgi:S1-C subfamily serine protease